MGGTEYIEYLLDSSKSRFCRIQQFKVNIGVKFSTAYRNHRMDDDVPILIPGWFDNFFFTFQL